MKPIFGTIVGRDTVVVTPKESTTRPVTCDAAGCRAAAAYVVDVEGPAGNVAFDVCSTACAHKIIPAVPVEVKR